MKNRNTGRWGIVALLLLSAVGNALSQEDSAWVSITSSVSSVNIYADSLYLGIAPLDSVRMPAGMHILTAIEGTPLQWDARRESREVNLMPGSTLILRFDFPADSAAMQGYRGRIDADPLLQPQEIRIHPLLITGSSVGIVSGIASVYFKMRANAKYDDYLANGSAESLRQTHRLDTLAGVTLGLSQIGLALVAYYLLSE